MPTPDHVPGSYQMTSLAHGTEKLKDDGSSHTTSVKPNEHDNDPKSGSKPEEEEKPEYLSGWSMFILCLGLCVTTFLIGLDMMIIATALPKISTQFKSTEDLGWYGSAYLLTTTSLQPSFGKIYQFYNIKYIFSMAVVFFEIGSVICAIAPNSALLIIGRAVAGIGAAGLFSGSMTIIGFAAPLRSRAIYLAAVASMFGISSIVGPILGGVFTDKLTWRWCFWINLPFGALGIFVVLLFFKNPQRRKTQMTFMQKFKDMDPWGALFLISAIVCLLLALQWGGLEREWNDSRVWGCLLGFVLLTTVFICIQIKMGDKAIIPGRVLKKRSVTAVALTLFFMSMGMYIHVFFLPFYFQAVKGYTAEQSGIRTVPFVVSNTIGSIITGGLVAVIGYYTPFIYLGTALYAVGAGLLHTLQVNSPKSAWIGYQILAGGASGMALQLPFIATQVVLSDADMPIGNAIAIFSQSLGGAISVSIASNVFNNALQSEFPIAKSAITPEMRADFGATAIRKMVPEVMLPLVLKAYNKALTDAFIIPIVAASISFFTSLLFEWKSVKGKLLPGRGDA